MNSKKKKTTKRAVLVLAVVLVLLLVALVSGKEKELPAASAALPTQAEYESGYQKYLEENGYDGTLASSEIVLDLENFKTEGELTAEIGEEGILTAGDGTITWNFRVQEAGFYNLALGYIALPGTTSDIQRKIYLDGELPYTDLGQIVIKRWWQDDAIRMKNKNELRPNAYEVYSQTNWFVEDSNRRNAEPLLFYLDKGSHTISFETVKEPLEITSLVFCAQEKAPAYAEAIEELERKTQVYGGKTLVLQAERVGEGMENIIKSSSAISVQKNHSDSEVVPYHAFYNRYNTIGAESWENPGESISWIVSAPEEGLYQLTFKGRQHTNRGVTSYRRLYVNGVMPYSEMNAIGFDYNTQMNNYTVSDEEGNSYLFYLNKGTNTITLENVMGPFGSILSQVEESMEVLNSSYLRVIQLTGQSPYKYIDYQIAKKIPEFAANMQAESERLNAIVENIVAITGEKGENTALLEKMAIQAAGLAEDPESVIEELAQLKNNISAVGTWLVQVSAMPLELDSLLLSGPDSDLPKATDSMLAGVSNETLRFLASFVIKTNAVGGEDTEIKDPLTVWVASYGKEQAQIMQNLVDDSFTPNTGIGVRIQLIPVDVVLRAALAGNGPDVVIGLAQSTVQDFAMRNATLDLTKLDGYEKVASKFYESTLQTAQFGDGVYGLPETANFVMMFYRQDILQDLGLEVPSTWEEFIELLPVLQQNNFNVFVPNAYLNDGSGNLNYYLSLIYQYGGDVYMGEGSEYGKKSGLDSDEAMEAFKDYTDFYTNYGLPVQADFSNRFRTGEIPIGITNYTTFCQLEIFAPEIKGMWSFAPIPGIEKADGTIDNTVVVDTVDTVIMRQTDDPDAAWEFLQWWMETDTQLSYCTTVEAIMGTAARVATANPEVMEQLPWSNRELKSLSAQLNSSIGVRSVPGYYMTNRMISYSFSDVIANNSNPREILYLNMKSIDKELQRKRTELGLVSGKA